MTVETLLAILDNANEPLEYLNKSWIGSPPKKRKCLIDTELFQDFDYLFQG